MSVPFHPRLYTNGTYTLAGGYFYGGGTFQVNAGGTYNQDGGTSTFGYVTANGALNLSGGDLVAGVFTVGADGAVVWTGGTIRASDSAAIPSLQFTGPGASWTMRGPTLTVNRFGGGGASSLVITNGATLQGYGTLQDGQYGGSSPGTFNNSGRVIANGYGVGRTLDASRWNNGYLANGADNTSSNGWFAVSNGTLRLPAVAVTAGASTKNWGEPDADTTLDLVNSARIDFTGATAGSLMGQLLAADCAAVPADLKKPIGIWTFSGVTCMSAVVTFRYDPAAATALGMSETSLSLLRHNGSKWVDLTASLDNSAKTITSRAIDAWPTSATFFAVALPPPSGAVFVFR